MSRSRSRSLAGAPAHLLAEVGAAGGQVAVPAAGAEPHHRAGLLGQPPAAQQGAPVLAAGELLGQQQVGAEPVQAATQAAGQQHAVVGVADRTELVGRAVAEKPQDLQRPAPPPVQGQQADRLAGPADHGEAQGAALPVPIPPGRRPLPGGEQVAAALGQFGPERPQRGQLAGRL
jgi:hypothetical protein